MTMHKQAVVLFSGGMDSATLLYSLVKDGFDVYPIGFNYRQRHQVELEYAYRFCKVLGVSGDFQSVFLEGPRGQVARVDRRDVLPVTAL